MSQVSALEQLSRLPDEKVIQDSAGQKRICYGCGAGDLFVWMDETAQKVTGFELTYYTSGDNREEHLIRWDGKQLSTGQVDSCEVDGRSHDLKSPTVQMSLKKNENIIRRGQQFLRERGAVLPQSLTDFIARLLAVQ